MFPQVILLSSQFWFGIHHLLTSLYIGSHAMITLCIKKSHLLFLTIKPIILLFILSFSCALINPAAVFSDQFRFKQMWPALLQPWYFYGISCIAIDGSSNVYVADSGNNRILKFTLNGQLIATWGKIQTPFGWNPPESPIFIPVVFQFLTAPNFATVPIA